MKLTPFRKLCLIILGAIFALLIMLSSLAGLLLLFNLLNYLCVDVQTSIKDVVCNYGALLFIFWLISHFALVLLVDDDLALSNLRKLIVQHRVITLFLIYSTVGMFTTHLFILFLGNDIYSDETDKYHGNAISFWARFPLLNVFVYVWVLIKLRRNNYMLGCSDIIQLYVTGRLAYFLLQERENRTITKI